VPDQVDQVAQEALLGQNSCRSPGTRRLLLQADDLGSASTVAPPT